MKKFLVVLNILIWTVVATEARASDREVFGAVIGAVIGYQIAKSTAPQPQVIVTQPVYVDPRSHRIEDIRRPQYSSPRCWNRLDRIDQYGRPIYMQECI